MRKVRSVVAEPRKLVHYARWVATAPCGWTLQVSASGTLSGFDRFSDYWGTLKLVPTDAERGLFARTLNDGDPVAFAVGANIGAFCVAMADVDAEVVVHAFEPVRSTFTKLVENIRRNSHLNGEIIPRQIGVSDSSGYAPMIVDQECDRTNRMAPEPPRTAGTEQVEVVSLDDYCRAHSIKRITLLKVDVEGPSPSFFRAPRAFSRAMPSSASFLKYVRPI